MTIITNQIQNMMQVVKRAKYGLKQCYINKYSFLLNEWTSANIYDQCHPITLSQFLI